MMENSGLINFDFGDNSDVYPDTKQRIRATLLLPSLNDPGTIDLVLAELEGCSFLFPSATIVVDWQLVENLSHTFVQKFSALRRRVQSRGGALKLKDDSESPSNGGSAEWSTSISVTTGST